MRTSSPQVGRHRPLPRQTVLYGLPLEQSLEEAMSLIDASRIALVTTRSLSTQARSVARLERLLGHRWVGTISGAQALSPRTDVIRITGELAGINATGVVAFGGSSVCDTVKAARLCLGNDVSSAAGIDGIRLGHPVSPPKLGCVMIPTTLSAAEYTPYAGVIDESGPRHEALHHEDLPPAVVILDPDLSVATPPRLWLSTGMRAVDHAVETWCSIDRTAFSDATSLEAIRLLIPALRTCAQDAEDRRARLDCLVGAWLSIQGFAAGVSLGGSHGIGHALAGTTRMPHGETSCVMLAHVLRFNRGSTADRQRSMCGELGILESDDAGAAIEDLVSAIGMPARLRDCGVSRDQLERVARAALDDRCVKRNPRPITDVEDIEALLHAAW